MNLYEIKEQLNRIPTPFYYYDTALLNATLDAAIQAAEPANAHIHYAVKANDNPRLLEIVAQKGLGADCVSGWEIERAIAAGIPASRIVFAGVGKSDAEIDIALSHNIAMFNVESVQELRVISQRATDANKHADIALRVNPNIDAHTHHNITTGLEENKFGIPLAELDKAISYCKRLPNISLAGLHFHIGSQITDLRVFRQLALFVNTLVDNLEKDGTTIKVINVGGGLGVDYLHPKNSPIADFKNYFATFQKYLRLKPHQQLHCELGRSLTAQWGVLIARTLYIKRGTTKRFAIIDAGFTELIRPALYGANHFIENLDGSGTNLQSYDIVGPICESTDVMASGVRVKPLSRGDLVAIYSAGAYGHVMASTYNCRPLVREYFTEDIETSNK